MKGRYNLTERMWTMKKLQDFWHKNNQNKLLFLFVIVIIFICLIALCGACGIATWLITSESSPAPAPAPAPTTLPTAIPTEGTSQELEYLNNLQEVLDELVPLWNEFTLFAGYGSTYPEAIDDPEWCNEFKELLDQIDSTTEKLAKLPTAPEKFSELHRIVIEFSEVSKEITNIVRLYLDTQDEALTSELQHLQERMLELQNQLNAELARLQNR